MSQNGERAVRQDNGLIPVVGLVGGIGSGKSSVARQAGSQHNLIIIDADQIGHEILSLPSVKKQLRPHFGETIFDEQGDVDRPSLGRAVFGADANQQAARTNLESVVHPEIQSRIEEEIDKARRAPGVDAVILDAAVLFEAGWDHLCDGIVFFDVPLPQRMQRVAESRGWTAQEFERRESSQMPVESKRKRAQYAVDNTGSLVDAGLALGRILALIKH